MRDLPLLWDVIVLQECQILLVDQTRTGARHIVDLLRGIAEAKHLRNTGILASRQKLSETVLVEGSAANNQEFRSLLALIAWKMD